jgi:hypothetical protein
MFALSSDITIGGFRFSGVNEVQVSQTIHSVATTASIKIPSVASIIKSGKVQPGKVITGNQFKEGDPVVIKLGYNNQLNTEFSGFVTRVDLNMPLQVECEGYSWLMRRNAVTGFHGSISVKDLLELAVSKIDSSYKINVQCDVDFQLSNIRITSTNGFEVLKQLSEFTDNCLTCFFIRPDTLWCGLLYTPIAKGIDSLKAGTVKYRIGYNVLKENSLKVRDTATDPIAITYTKKYATGTIITQTSSVFPNSIKKSTKILNDIKDVAALGELANEKAYLTNYSGYEGALNTFLEPNVLPGAIAYIEDNRYPGRTGNYLVESIQTNFGIRGARRTVEIGPKMGFSNV